MTAIWKYFGNLIFQNTLEINFTLPHIYYSIYQSQPLFNKHTLLLLPKEMWHNKTEMHLYIFCPIPKQRLTFDM